MPEDHSEAQVRFWAARPSCKAYYVGDDGVYMTTVYASPTKPYWYSLEFRRASMFGALFFSSEIQATEHFMATLIEQKGRIDLLLDAAADRYNELLLAEEMEHELSAEHTSVETW